MNKLIQLSAAAALGFSLLPVPVFAAGGEHEIERQHWSFSGFKGQYDKAQLQRGFLVYEKVCSTCHGLKRLSFRNLAEPGGPEFPEEAVKKLAAEWPNQISELSEDGESAVATKDKDGKPSGFKYVKRPALPSDPILGPYANDKAARAGQNGALPPDLSIIAKARGVHREANPAIHWLLMLGDIVSGYQEGGPDYVRALMTGYAPEAPAYKRDGKGKLVAVHDMAAEDKKALEFCATVAAGDGDTKDTCNTVQDGMNYNAAFPGHQISMPPPLTDGRLTTDDGYLLEPNVDNMARDVSGFLAWAADPSLNQRKRIGWQVMLYLLITTVLLYLAKKRVWSKIKH